MLWIGGVLNKTGIIIDKVMSQLDIAATLSSQTELDTAAFPFSKNVFDSSAKAWAFFSFNDGFGFVDSIGRLVYDNVGKLPILSEGERPGQKTEAGQAMMQFIYDDFIKK